MKELSLIEQACIDNDHEFIKDLLDSIESTESKREVFQKVIEHYENKSQFPVGYSLLFIKWLLQNNDLNAAMSHILKCREREVADERISEIIFDNLIRPEGSRYRENFNKNLLLLQEYKILFSNQKYDFEEIKNDLTVIANFQPTSKFNDLLQKEGKRILLVDVINIEAINKLLEKDNLIFLVYDEPHKFYYMLLFEDLSQLSQYIENKKIIFFADREKNLLKDFFSNMLVILPDYILDISLSKKYFELIGDIRGQHNKNISLWLESIKTYYRNLDYEYYKNLFSRDHSNIKILLLTSDVLTEVNKFIARNWHEAFLELGYQAKLITDSEPYEMMNNYFIYKAVAEYKPDMVFHINHMVNDIFKDDEVRKNLLWVLRYRDKHTTIGYAQKGFDYGNMFVLPMIEKWDNELKAKGVPSNRILHTFDGANINIFKKANSKNDKYACDIVAVNNAGGGETLRLNYYTGMVKDDRSKKLLNELYSELKEMFYNDIVFSSFNFKEFIDKKLNSLGIQTPEDCKQYLTNFCVHIIDALSRGRIIEWIVDSGITLNIKLWGKGWSNNEKFKPYHMGIAKHGKELASIYESSMISISDHPWSLHERNFEIMASGGFPMIIHAKHPDIDESDSITNYFRENEEVVLFYSKEDLLNKIQYYLDHPEERERIAENGRQVVINNFSHVAIAKKTMDFVKSYYLQNT